MKKFGEWLTKLAESDPAAEDMVARWKAMRQQAGWEPEAQANLAQQQPQQPQPRTLPANQPVNPASIDPATLSQNHNLVAANIQLALSPAGRKAYPFYWSDKDRRVKRNTAYTG